MGRIRWFIGLILVLCILIVIIFYPAGFLRRSLSVLFFCTIFCIFRILRGPTSADRIVAVDILGILIVGLCAILGVVTGRLWYIDIGIAWALQSFIATLALAKYLEGKSFDE